ncbi:RNA polymerase sigma factor [Paenibacillus flagellatus]|nr:RNA polymerase sigma factor [Paenibacillus flagellatus]
MALSGHSDRDRLLLLEIGTGSKEAFDRFYETYVPIMYRVAVRLTDNRMDAEDVVQDVLLDVLRRPEKYDPSRGTLEAWLLVKTKSKSLDALRKRSRTVPLGPHREQAPADTVPAPEEALLLRAEAETVRSALRGIPALQREALYGAYFESMTHRELAERLNRPLGTVKSLVRYGLNNIKKQLAAKGWTGAPKGGDRVESD